jgi:hypothetical protein
LLDVAGWSNAEIILTLELETANHLVRNHPEKSKLTAYQQTFFRPMLHVIRRKNAQVQSTCFLIELSNFTKCISLPN